MLPLLFTTGGKTKERLVASNVYLCFHEATLFLNDNNNDKGICILHGLKGFLFL